MLQLFAAVSTGTYWLILTFISYVMHCPNGSAGQVQHFPGVNAIIS
jgi:hypothetical protein